MSTHICRKIVSEKAPLPTTPGNRWDTAQTINISVRGKSPKKKKKKGKQTKKQSGSVDSTGGTEIPLFCFADKTSRE